ncbi:hypothetical protein ABFS83_14G234700 [Erythranthe nasuta]
MHLHSCQNMEETTQIIQYFEGKTIFITGATGFLAKVFSEKILRLQPNVKKLFLLIRPTAKQSIEQRLHDEVVNTELFGVLREELGDEEFDSTIRSKVVPVSGDVSLQNLGIVDSQFRQDLWHQIDIIVNSAATTKFDERYDVAFGINALGAMHVQHFARNCSKLQMLLQVSTAYVHGTAVGLIPEKPLHMGETLAGAKITHLDIDSEKKIISETLTRLRAQKYTEKEINIAMKNLGIERAMLHGWPNTYVFTKAIGEMLLEEFKEKGNVVIIRPTIITSTYSEPFPGWTEGLRTLDSIFVAYGKGNLKFFLGDPESTLDMIPGDMVVNCMVAAIALSRSKDETKHDLYIYHVGSSRQNPVKYSEVKWLMHRYLTENPLFDSGTGKPIRVGQPTTLNSMSSFHSYISTHYLPFLKILKIINMMSCNHLESVYSKARRSVDSALRLAELYKPYLFFQGIFDDVNTENLRKLIRGRSEKLKEEDVLNFDPKCIQWDDYFVNTHFRGIAKYVLKK